MALIERLRRITLVPWAVLRWLRISRAWERSDWPQMVSLLQPFADLGLDSSGDHILLGIAHSRQGHLSEALWYFEQVSRDELSRVEQPFYFNEYAHALARTGRPQEAQQLLGAALRDQWPEPQRQWAERFLASLPSETAPPLHGLKPRPVFH